MRRELAVAMLPVIGLFAFGCKGRSDAPAVVASGSAAPVLAPMSIMLGDCEDDPARLFSSGRQPEDQSTSEAGASGGPGNTQARVVGAARTASPPSFTYQVDAAYLPGNGNALKEVKDLLAACLRAAPVPAGVAVVELTYDLDGNATTALVHGIADEPTQACLATAAKQAHRRASDAPAQRCPFAYGALPVASLPALELSATTVALAGTALAPAGTDEQVGLAVRTAADQRERATTSRREPVVAIDGPLVVRPSNDTPMSRVLPVLRGLEAANASYVLAAQRGSEWKLLSPLDLPLPPVLLGGGKALTSAKVVRPVSADELSVFLSIDVTSAQVYLSLSHVNEVRAIPRDASAPGALASALVGMKASRYFGNRTDVDIAGAAGMTYGDLVPVIDAAMRAGFTHWSLAAPEDLAMQPPH